MGRQSRKACEIGINALSSGLSNTPISKATIGSSSIAPKLLPQVGQKVRLEKSDDRQVEGGPPGPVQLISSVGNSTQAVVSAPVCR
ncbi:hypothetical protein ATE76_04955 [Sphingopyxis sp. H093]|nr:hypothetical protein ATE76_04955 [Sphingopyxis sp. H093]KTE29943.1 hypothetical protein ATE75_05950 [Sphingopyxis sp. H080]